jgi:hypothetical protein
MFGFKGPTRTWLRTLSNFGISTDLTERRPSLLKAILKLNIQQRARLKALEGKLENCVKHGSVERAIEITIDIQEIFSDDRLNHRLLRDKLWCFEAALVANRLEYAETGINSIRERSAKGTKLRLEASVLLTVCYLRQKRTTDARRLIKFTLENINKIRSDRSRRLFHRKFLDRIEEEAVLSELVGTDDGELNPSEIHDKAVYLLAHNSQAELFSLIGNSLPGKVVLAIEDMRGYALRQIEPKDVKYLPAPEQATSPPKLGKKVFAVFKRVAWKAFCSADSSVFKLWNQRVPQHCNEGYLAAALVATMKEWRIGLPVLGAGILAIIMKYSAQEFCTWAKPETFMSNRKEVVGESHDCEAADAHGVESALR